jgi:hypothetical protein
MHAAIMPLDSSKIATTVTPAISSTTSLADDSTTSLPGLTCEVFAGQLRLELVAQSVGDCCYETQTHEHANESLAARFDSDIPQYGNRHQTKSNVDDDGKGRLHVCDVVHRSQW